MFYEEKVINGVLHFRGEPKGKWIKMSPELLTKTIQERDKEIEELKNKLDKLPIHIRQVLER